MLVDDRYVLKVANPGEDPDVLDMENAAMAHVRQVSPDLPVPALMPATSGAAVAAVTDAGGRRCLARLITPIVPGQSHEGRPVTCDLAEQAGGLAARTSLALQGLFHRAGGRVFDWDVRRAPAALAKPGVIDSLGAAGRPLAGLLPRLAATSITRRTSAISPPPSPRSCAIRPANSRPEPGNWPLPCSTATSGIACSAPGNCSAWAPRRSPGGCATSPEQHGHPGTRMTRCLAAAAP